MSLYQNGGAVRSYWQGWLDSNQRMRESKSLALPLGYTPIRERNGIGTIPDPALFVGWVKGLEPSTPGTTIRCSNQLSYTHHISGITREASPQAALGEMVRQKGFEPPAYCLEGSCSILLSYWRKWMEQVTGIEPASPAWKAGALAIVLHLQEPSATCQLLHDSTEAFRCQAKFRSVAAKRVIFSAPPKNCLQQRAGHGIITRYAAVSKRS